MEWDLISGSSASRFCHWYYSFVPLISLYTYYITRKVEEMIKWVLQICITLHSRKFTMRAFSAAVLNQTKSEIQFKSHPSYFLYKYL